MAPERTGSSSHVHEAPVASTTPQTLDFKLMRRKSRSSRDGSATHGADEYRICRTRLGVSHHVVAWSGCAGDNLREITHTPRPVSDSMSAVFFREILQRKISEGFVCVDLNDLLRLQTLLDNSAQAGQAWFVDLGRSHARSNLGELWNQIGEVAAELRALWSIREASLEIERVLAPPQARPTQPSDPQVNSHPPREAVAFCVDRGWDGLGIRISAGVAGAGHDGRDGHACSRATARATTSAPLD